jgi:hypothetical protein
MDDEDENWAYPRALSSGRICPGKDNNNYECEGEVDTSGGEKETGAGMG